MQFTQKDIDNLAAQAKQDLMARALREVTDRQDFREYKDHLVAEIRGRLVKKLRLTPPVSGDVDKEASHHE